MQATGREIAIDEAAGHFLRQKQSQNLSRSVTRGYNTDLGRLVNHCAGLGIWKLPPLFP